MKVSTRQALQCHGKLPAARTKSLVKLRCVCVVYASFIACLVVLSHVR